MSRKRGHIVLVGVVGLNLRRSDFYQKELSFQVSCSYGPGRYDEKYEQGGQDYPYGFVRWTEQRNFEAVLEAIKSGKLVVDELITDRFEISDAESAYQKVTGDRASLGVILQYPGEVEPVKTITVTQEAMGAGSGKAVLGVIGAGNFSKMTMVPALSKSGAAIKYVADLNTAAAKHLASKFSIAHATSDYKEILADESVDAVLIPLRHNLHARFVIEALEAGKHVFVEKPLALTVEELEQVIDTAGKHPDRMIMVGFNRRFSPHIIRMKDLLTGRSEPLAMTMTVNAGIIPPEVWVHDPQVGGGRIVGEGCHFIDLMVHLTGSRVSTVSGSMAGQGVAVHEDKMSITLGFEDGSVGSVNYFANGSKSYPKERLVVFSEGRVLEMDNFRRTVGYGFKGFRKFKTSRQDKGHLAEFAAFTDSVASGGDRLIPFDELVNVTLASFAAMTGARENRTIILSREYGKIVGE